MESLILSLSNHFLDSSELPQPPQTYNQSYPSTHTSQNRPRRFMLTKCYVVAQLLNIPARFSYPLLLHHHHTSFGLPIQLQAITHNLYPNLSSLSHLILPVSLTPSFIRFSQRCDHNFITRPPPSQSSTQPLSHSVTLLHNRHKHSIIKKSNHKN